MRRFAKKMQSTPCLSLWERWTSAARTERVSKAAMPSQSPSVTALPEGEPRAGSVKITPAPIQKLP